MKRLKTLDLSGCYRVENLSENLQHEKFLEELDLTETAITEPPSFIFQFKNLKVLSFNGCKRGRTNSIAPMLPSFSGLSSLRELKLRDCNLCEGDIPRDVSGLSFLKELDLSGNNFVSIPASLTRLSKLEVLILSNCNMCTLGEADIHGLSSLKWLYLNDNNFITVPLALTQLSKLKLIALSNCMKLNSLPELPTSIEDVWLEGCSSLEVVASPSKEVKSQNGLANKKVTPLLRFPYLSTFKRIVNGLELLVAAFLSIMMLQRMWALSTAER
ncbi:TMV resistance protein N-like [Gossypium arboreum]|uniref:TMV resistance protein N-like n=1 Tax=Gossypium arboreum TaxID=29729 RepID=UPI0022F178E0|nr:TMV resistance protein N-like [Gossypium arboreum]